MSLKISIITVCKNSESTIYRCLKSIHSQDYLNIEHIVIDGLSSDSTVSFLEEFSEKISYFISEPDYGIYDAMNKGLDKVTGDVVCFLNADDYYVNNQVLSSVATKIINKNLDAVIGDIGFFKKNNPKKIVRRYRSSFFKIERISWGLMPAHPALFLRQKVVKKVGYFNLSYKIAADFEYIIRTFCRQPLRFEFLPEMLVYMQIGGLSTKDWRSKLIINKEVILACKENGIKTNYLKILLKYPIKLLEFI